MTFWEWLDQQGIHLMHREPADGEFFLAELNEEETEVILERYLRNIRLIYGEPYAGKHVKEDV